MRYRAKLPSDTQEHGNKQRVLECRALFLSSFPDFPIKISFRSVAGYRRDLRQKFLTKCRVAFPIGA